MNPHLARALVVTVVILLGAPSVLPAQDATIQSAAAAQAAAVQAATPAKPAEKRSGWEVTIYPLLAYIPLAGIDVTLPEEPPCTGCPPSVPSASGDTGLSGAWFAAFRVEKGRFALAGDINYAGLEAKRSSPVFDVKLNVIAGGATVGFKIVEGLYAEIGAKYYELDVTAKILTFPEVGWKPNTFQPTIGTTFRPQIAKRWRLYSHLDYAGIGSDVTTVNGNARLEWRPIRYFALTAGYGFSTVHADGEIGRKPISLKYTLHGPIIGFGIPF